ncbi:MAG TPA: sigma-70 family RNA polymerase sigma factor [Acidobacteriaceae bacterium]|nr:sigma-70 family RNA polymerase sigma factor [Acidobacteriaceae bacterium]
MQPNQEHEITRLLVAWSHGEESALEALTPIVYEELRQLARRYMRQERPGHTLQSTAIVHEAFLRLVNQNVAWNDRTHFFSIAAKMMRRILVDHARSRSTSKRGAGMIRVSVDEHNVASPQQDVDLVALDEALDHLASIDPQRSRIVELRYFGGLSNEESAQILGISPATVQRQWTGARAWLYHELTNRPIA